MTLYETQEGVFGIHIERKTVLYGVRDWSQESRYLGSGGSRPVFLNWVDYLDMEVLFSLKGCRFVFLRSIISVLGASQHLREWGGASNNVFLYHILLLYLVQMGRKTT